MIGLEVLQSLAELARDPEQLVPSPCISVCRMDPHSSVCLGCYRTLDEIVAWGRSSEAQKRMVWKLVTQRAGITLT